MATTTDPIRRRRSAPWLALLALALILAACGDDGGDDDSSSSDADTESTETADDETGDEGMSDDEEMSDDDMGDEEAGDSIGVVEVDGEGYPLDNIIGILSCDFEDPDGDFSVAAESADDVAYLALITYGNDPDSNEFTVSIGETEYVAESPDAIEYSTVGRTVTGTVAVVPLFEEGTPQDVVFEVNCP